MRICEEIQGVSAIDFVSRGSKAYVGTAFDQGLNVSTCINCGQCIVSCPTGALAEKSYIEEVVAALSDPEMMVVVQHAPSVSVSLAEEFGVELWAHVDHVILAMREESEVVSMDHYREALKRVRPSIEESMISYYERISERFKGGAKVEPSSLIGYR